ncbi:MAG: leucine-rich repeat protein [Clostridia bacterium]|nr:leucine-rich repeat protein [Clostridia bacterium]
MNDLENGYVYADSNGNAHFVSYNSIGSGLGMVVLLVLATVFIKDANMFLINNKWVIIVPTLISVLIRTLVSDIGIRLNKRIINIVGDTVKTICMYSVLLTLIDEVAGSHWLDRVLFAFLYGALLFGASWLIDFVLRYLRTAHFCIAHLIVCLMTSALALCLYFNHAWYWQGYEYTVFLNKASIVKIDEQMEGTIEIPSQIYNYTVESIGENAFDYNKKVTHIELPDTIKVIKENAFGLANNLQEVIIPKSVEKIEKSLFSFNYDFEIYYEGSQEDWDKINIQDNNIKTMTIHFNSP